jgi:MFS family permease
MRLRFGKFYGWTIVAMTAAAMMLIYGVRHSFSIFFPSILEEYGWARGDTALMLSLNVLLYGCAAPFAGILADRWHPKKTMVIGVLVLGASISACAFATRLLHFYFLFGLCVPVGMALCGWPLLAPALANWFMQNRGLAIGLSQAGLGLSFAYGIFVRYTIDWLGWRPAYVVVGVSLILILMPLYLVFFVFRPEERGLRAHGAKEPLQPRPPGAATPPREPTRVVLKNPRLWLLAASNFFYWGLGTYTVLGHQIKFVEDFGLSGIFAASIFGLFGIFMFCGQLCSSVSDRTGREAVAAAANALAAAGLLALLSFTPESGVWRLYAYAVCFGLGAGLFTPTIFAGAVDIFYGRSLGTVGGVILLGMGAGAAFGPWLGGFLHDVSGSYRIAFYLCLGFFTLSLLAFILAAPRKGPQP